MFFRHRVASSIGAVGAVIKVVCVVAADLAAFALVVYLAVRGEWVGAAVMLFIGIPIVSFVVDIATGLVLMLFVGLAVLVGWRAKAPEPDYEAY